MQWKHAGSPTVRKFRTGESAGKAMASIFWDCEGDIIVDLIDIFIDYVNKLIPPSILQWVNKYL